MADEEIPESVFLDAARAMVAMDPSDDPEVYGWHRCEGCPRPTGPCACAGAPYPSRVVRAAVTSAFRAGREAAAQAILAHADEWAPNDGTPNAAQRTLRRHLHIAARVATGPPTLDQVAEALRKGDFAVCYLDDAGRSVAHDSKESAE